MKILTTVLLCLWLTGCLCLQGIGQQPVEPDNIRFGIISSPQGLSQSSVFSLAQDSKGFIWIGTRDGLNRYDGYDFITYKTDPKDTNSISNNEITVIHPDRYGDIWIGTRGGGLNKYITRSNRFLRFSYLTPENIVRDIHESTDSILWVGSSDGLLRADISDRTRPVRFVNVSKKSIYKDDNGQLLSHQKTIISVVSINQISQDTLLIGTEMGLFYYLPAENLFTRFNAGDANDFIVTSIHITAEKAIWIGSFNGLIKAERDEQYPGQYKLTIYSTRQQDIRHFFSNRIESLVEDSFGNIWVGTRGGGLVKIQKNGVLHHFRNNENDINSIRDNIVNSLLIDNTGVLWIGTESQGCNTLDLFSRKFMHIRSIPNNSNSLSGALVTAITGAAEHTVWVGTAVAGLDKLKFDENGNYTIEHLRTLYVSPDETTSEVIDLMLDRDNELWIGNATNSLIRYSEDYGFRSYFVEGFVFALQEDHEGRIWYGTWGQGLGWIDKKTNTLNRVLNSPDATRSLSSDKVISLFEDSFGNLWVGTKGGGVNVLPLHMVRTGNIDFLTYRHNLSDPGSLSHNDVYCIMQDHSGHLWIGTGGGLNKVVWDKNQSFTEALLKGDIEFTGYLEKDGLSNGVVYGILEDQQGNLWLSTNNGMSMFDPEEKRFINYNVNDGLQANEFYANAYYKDDRGNIFFGGVNGLTMFNPDSIRYNPLNSKVILTGLRILNKIVLPGETINNRVVLKDAVFNTDKLRLSYKDKEITLEFSALYYANPQQIRYQYRLVGFNDEWQQADRNTRTATYTNLDDGHYVFEVRATNDNGLTSGEVTKLEISVLPPYWRKPWFFLIYVALIVAGLILFRSYSLIAVKEKNKLLIERLEHKKLLEMTEAKMRFLTNISHEIRTPLTLINDPLDVVLDDDNINNEAKKNLRLVSKNVQRLLNLANQLLQLRKIDLGVLQPKIAQVNLISFLKDILAYFEQNAARRNIRLNFCTDLQDVPLNIDPEMMTTVFYNLIVNAFKYTADEGSISILVRRQEGQVQPSLRQRIKKRLGMKLRNPHYVAVEISDTGKGIPEKELSNIFRRFYQVNLPETDHNTGSGIGLSLVKEYVDIHKGFVEVKSGPKGSRFVVYLPDKSQAVTGTIAVAKQHAEEESVLKAQHIETFTEEEDADAVSAKPEVSKVQKEKSHILIIEDDHELADYLAENLGKNYKVNIAYNGAKGLKTARSELPELIISDIMLPEMNGLKLCKSLKTNIETSHIPVILITARAAEENVNEGYKLGADLYVTKPFSVRVLESQVNMLIESRNKLRDRYCKQILLKPADVTITSVDEKFLRQLMHVTETNLSNSDFDVIALVEAMHMSHTTILRKVKALTGLSLVEFIKNHRIKKAALIFQQQKMPVSEVSYMVGFTDPKYFTKCFVKEFGKTPTEYIFECHPENK
ncbi:MAG: response regulator [Bacteroidales bacterium]|nr:response regulator [Bacteroidales bacterium]MBN2763449.1 response regulator [Bacteroidales bacterium]